jgi:hypothetical protein
MEIDSIVVHVGFNEIMKSSSEQLKLDFKELNDSVLDANKIPIISGPVPTLNRGIEHFSKILYLHNWLRDYCSSMDVTFVDDFDTSWKQNTLNKEDEIHPNHLGSRILSQHYKAVLRQ